MPDEGWAVDLAEAAGRLSRTLENAAVISGADGAALMLLDQHADLRAVGATTGEGMELEVIQQSSRSGPAFDCLTTGAPVAVENMPERAPVRAVLSLPVSAYGRMVGALNLYRHAPTRWRPDHIAAAQRLADVLAVFLEMLARPTNRAVGRTAARTAGRGESVTGPDAG
ncbi:GAF domain-containing protein [Actinomadura barringtoniae]|uniref:GAF domain-containing protein n=1 Tax=Actinomadura barringtoniae TaxID=1427535 RepID=A0A939PMI2_9ACTN|nr:GAF domain-containing protein [Actinomadura barringtoniae]MBO2452624.1 GAF domain-containing protein [Actinomadura barringtoniae]